jgi:uncharacterized protein (UPF0264 family)
MQLLVSVQDAAEACVAVECGADVIDAKNPSRGPLGPIDARVLHAITAAVRGRKPVSAALGDVDADVGPDVVSAEAAAAAGVAFAKVSVDQSGGGCTNATRVAQLVDLLRRHERPGSPCGLVLAAYADGTADAGQPDAVLEVASRWGASGILLDTCRKGGPGLFDLMPLDDVTTWVAAGHAAGLLVALAGSLGAADVARARATGADLIGVRGAACDGGREGRISAERVRALARAVAG